VRIAPSTTTTSCRSGTAATSPWAVTTRPERGSPTSPTRRPGRAGLVGPPALSPPDLGGEWSAYWYNNFIYESSIAEGLNVFRFSGSETGGAIRLDHLNPQTQEFSLG
jgi:hypothetical protein